MKPIAIITADWHLTDHAWKWRSNLSGDALFGLKQIAETSVKYGLPIIVAGDMFDTKRPPLDIMLRVREQLRHTCGYFVQGNHDKVTGGMQSWFSLAVEEPKWVNLNRTTGGEFEIPVNIETGAPAGKDSADLLEGARLELEAQFKKDMLWFIHGIDYTETQEHLSEKLDYLDVPQSSNAARILVLHQGCTRILGIGEAELDHDMIPDRYNFVICGHFHKPSLTTIRTRTGREIPCLSPGGIHLLSVVEDPMKRLYFLCDDGSVYSKRLFTRRVIKQDMRNATESQIHAALAETVKILHKKSVIERPPELETPLVAITYNTSTVESLRTLVESVFKNEGLEAHLFFKDASDKDTYEIEIAGGLESETTLETGFHYATEIFRQSESDPQVRRIVETMIGNEPSQEVYNTIKNEFLENYA